MPDRLILKELINSALAKRIGAGLIEPGVYKIVMDTDRISDLQGTENQLAAGRAEAAHRADR